MAANWQEIATELYEALRSFTAHIHSNEGNWRSADKAIEHYEYAAKTWVIVEDRPLYTLSSEQLPDETRKQWKERTFYLHYGSGSDRLPPANLEDDDGCPND